MDVLDGMGIRRGGSLVLLRCVVACIVDLLDGMGIRMEGVVLKVYLFNGKYDVIERVLGRGGI